MKIFRRRKQSSAEEQSSGLEEAPPGHGMDHASILSGAQVEDMETPKEVRNLVDVLLATEHHDDPHYFHRDQPIGNRSHALMQSAPRSNEPEGSNNQNIQPNDAPPSASANRRGSASLFRRASRGMRRLTPRAQGMLFRDARDMNSQEALETQIHQRMKQSFQRRDGIDDQSSGPSWSS